MRVIDLYIRTKMCVWSGKRVNTFVLVGLKRIEMDGWWRDSVLHRRSHSFGFAGNGSSDILHSSSSNYPSGDLYSWNSGEFSYRSFLVCSLCMHKTLEKRCSHPQSRLTGHVCSSAFQMFSSFLLLNPKEGERIPYTEKFSRAKYILWVKFSLVGKFS